MALKNYYRLQTLFDIKKRAKEAAESTYGWAQQAVAAETKKLNEMNERLQELKQVKMATRERYLVEIQGANLAIKHIHCQNIYLAKLDFGIEKYSKEVADQKQKLDDAEQHAADSLESMIFATCEFKTIEKHKEKWAKVERHKILRVEEDSVDEISQTQYFEEKRCQE